MHSSPYAQSICRRRSTIAPSFFDAVAQRRTIREIAATPLNATQISGLLWSACGVNRDKGAVRCAGTHGRLGQQLAGN